MSRCLTCGRRGCRDHAPGGAAATTGPGPTPALLPAIPGYRTVRLLGRGGFGTVVEAVGEAGQGAAAVKVARADVPEARAQLAREAEALREVGSTAAPALLGTGALADGTPFVAMELVAAPSLADLLAAAAGPLPPADFARIAPALLDALAAVHAAGQAHGDLKPENVLLEGAPPRARLIDFGLSQPLGVHVPARVGTLAGTPEYMSPEQCRGLPPDARSDVYAAGALLFEMATGRPPFFGPPAEVRHGHVNLRPPRPSALAGVASALEPVLLRCLAKEPADRYASGSELRQALAQAAARPTVSDGAAPAAADATPAAGGAERRTVAVLYLESPLDPLAVKATASSLGGVVAHAAGGRFALVFDPAAGEHPVRLALRAAHAAVARRLSPRALVDLQALGVVARAGGAPRYLAAAFARPGSYPLPGDPPGALATARALDVLPGVSSEPVPGREGIALCKAEAPGAEAPTVAGQGGLPLVGREAELAELEELARRAIGERAPTVAAVLGEAGLGKSRLADALAARLRALAPAPAVLDLRARQAADGGEAGALGGLLRRALDLPAAAAAPADGGRAALLLSLPPELAEGAWPVAALALGWLAPGAPELRSLAAAPGALAALTVRTLGGVLRRRASLRPLCILVDDAHLAGGMALDALEFAALAEANAPIFACALARPEFARSRPAWGDRAARSRTLALEPLPPPEASDLCRRLLAPADSVPARALDLLVGRTRGVPLLLVELVRSLKREGLVRQHAEGGWYLATDELERVPDMPVVDWLAERQLRSLPAELVPHAQVAALLGDEVSPAETAGVQAGLEAAGQGAAFPLDGAAATRRLLALGLLAGHHGGRTSVRLPLVRDTLARSTPEPVRRAVHEAACRYHEDPRTGPDAERLPRLLRHAEALGRRAQAAALGLRLAEAARARHAYLLAESLYSRTVASLPEAPSLERLAALRGRGLMRYRLDRHEDSVADLGAARAMARGLGDRATEVDCLLDEATALDWMGDHDRSRACSREAAALARLPAPDQQARLDLARGRSLFRAGQWAEAASALSAAAALAGRGGDEAYETLAAALLLLGHILPPLGRTAEAEAALGRAGELARARGDDLHLSVVHMNERNLLVARGDLGAALRCQEETVRLGRELGIVGNEFYGEYNMTELLYQAGDLAAAEAHLKRALEIEARHPEVSPTRGLPLLLAARILLLRGDLPAARQRLGEFRQGLERARARGWHGGEASPNEEVLADMVDLATRDADDGEWDRLLARSADHSLEQEPIEVVEMRGLAALRAGRPEPAGRALEEALRLAGRLPTLMVPRLRQALARVPAAPR